MSAVASACSKCQTTLVILTKRKCDSAAVCLFRRHDSRSSIPKVHAGTPGDKNDVDFLVVSMATMIHPGRPTTTTQRYRPLRRIGVRPTRNAQIIGHGRPRNMSTDTTEKSQRDIIRSVYDRSENWEDWFKNDEYQDAWGCNDDDDDIYGGLDPLDYPPLDNASRYVVELLDDMLVGLRKGLDKPTTARCNQVIRNLSDVRRGGKKLQGRAQRADAILKRMEKISQSRGSCESLKYELPHPNKVTYFLVLKLYAQTKGPKAIAERAEQVVHTMAKLYDEGDIEMKPTVIDWNQVLSAWAISTHPDKAFHAANLLGRIKDIADSSSYGHALRACALSDLDGRSKKLAAEVALRVWKDFEKSELEPTSYSFSIFLQSCGYIADRTKRDQFVEDAFTQCRERGLVNAHVLFALERVASDELYKNLLGRAVKPSGSKTNVTNILQKVPKVWTRNAAMSNEWGW